jgi:hypothetical protein
MSPSPSVYTNLTPLSLPMCHCPGYRFSPYLYIFSIPTSLLSMSFPSLGVLPSIFLFISPLQLPSSLFFCLFACVSFRLFPSVCSICLCLVPRSVFPSVRYLLFPPIPPLPSVFSPLSLSLCSFPSVFVLCATIPRVEIKLKYAGPLLSLTSDLGSGTGFPVWCGRGRKMRKLALFSFAHGSHAFLCFFFFALASAKARKKRGRSPVATVAKFQKDFDPHFFKTTGKIRD